MVDIPLRCSDAVRLTLCSALVGMLEELWERLMSDVLPAFPLASSSPKAREELCLALSAVPPAGAPLDNDSLDKVLLPSSSTFPESPSLDFFESLRIKKLPLRNDNSPSWFLGASAFAFDCPSLELRFSLSPLLALLRLSVPSFKLGVL